MGSRPFPALCIFLDLIKVKINDINILQISSFNK